MMEMALPQAQSPPYFGRREAYTASGVRRLRCSRCGEPCEHQWSVCANGNRFLGVCAACDVAVNAWVLRFMLVPHAEELIAAYAARMGVPVPP